jgi:hypothetical protein
MRSRDLDDDHVCEILLWIAGFVFAAFVSQDAFFLVPLGACLALLGLIRLKGEEWTLMRFGWLMVILITAMGAALIAFAYAALTG